MEVSGVPFYDVTIREEAIFDGAALILRKLRPEWQSQAIRFKVLTDGITNKLVRCMLPNSRDEENILVRIYGSKTDLLIDRTAEIRNIMMLNKLEMAPRLYATFLNGLAYEYVPGLTLDEKSVTQPEIYRLVARHTAKLHQIERNGDDKTPMLWGKLADFLALVPERFRNKEINNTFLSFGHSKADLQQEITTLRKRLEMLDSPIVFAHNDILLGNVIYAPDTQKITFIDYEYAAYNYQAFDIGNHFAEFVGLDNSSYALYPSKALQCDWLREYLTVMTQAAVVRDDDVERLYVAVNQFALASHLFWGIWALVQAELSTIDFDFIGYAIRRLGEYFNRKEAFLSLTVPPLS